MRNFLCVLALSATAIGCGNEFASGPCGNTPLVGSWHGTNNGQADVLALDGDCSGTSSYCGTTFTYPAVVTNAGTVLFTVTSTSGKSGCLPVGQTT